MADEITLSVVDQSPLRKGGTAADALRESVELAKAVEGLGYRRYWVAEHHNSSSFTGTSPELLIGQIAAQTTRIRVGSGGVMLPHYSALKVAEQFRVLESFFPGRIDLGIGRAPGSDQLTAAALSYPRPQMDVAKFPQQIVDLLGFLAGRVDKEHPFAEVKAQAGPTPASTPEVWLLGSSDHSARLAAVLGLPFAFADFFGTTGGYGPVVAELYRREFKPSGSLKEPKVNVAIQVMCAPTEEEALFLASSRNLNKVASFHLEPDGKHEVNRLDDLGQGLIPPHDAASYSLGEDARRYLDGLKQSYIDGSPEQVREGIAKVAERYATDDVSIVTNCYAFEDRARSYELVAEAFGVGKTPHRETRDLRQRGVSTGATTGASDGSTDG